MAVDFGIRQLDDWRNIPLTEKRRWLTTRPLALRALTAWVTGGDLNNHTRHRNVQGGASRAAVLGAGDGLITNVSLILGVAGASTAASPVRLAGVAGLLAGAFSMAAGELVSVRAQDELVERELQVVVALNGAPGIYSARWAGPDKNFAAAMGRVEREAPFDRAAHPR